MKVIVSLTLTLLFSIVLSAWERAEIEENRMINPGDEVDGMVFTTTNRMDWDISLADLCNSESVAETSTNSTMPCAASWGSQVFFGSCARVWFDNPEDAEMLWQEFNLEVTFDNQLINLPSFGYMDIELPESDKRFARIWNLMVENITPGIHTIERK